MYMQVVYNSKMYTRWWKSRDLFIPGRWRSLTTIGKGHVNSPSKKGHQQTCQVHFLPWMVSIWLGEFQTYLRYSPQVNGFYNKKIMEKKTVTLPETNRKFAPENQCLEDEVSFWG